MQMRPALVLTFAVLLVLSSARPSDAAWPHDYAVNLRVASSAYAQDQPRIASDGSGGFFFTWQELSASTGLDVYAQHVTAGGAVASGWPAGGQALYAGSSDQTNPTVLSDGVGGAYFAWEDKRANGLQRDIYITRLAGDGSIAPGWVAGGVPIQQDAKDEYLPLLLSDGAGGVFVFWTYAYSGTDTDIYAAHFLASGTKPWTVALIQPIGFQSAPSAVKDGAGGFIVSYIDETSGLGKDVRTARFNGNASQQFDVSVRTQAGDQFGAVAAEDGEGGAIIAYLDNNSGAAHVYASRITANGSFAPGWSTVGNKVCGAANNQFSVAIVPDGGHGAIVGWLDSRAGSLDIYASRVTAYGTLSLGWTPDGNGVSTNTSLRSAPAMAPDGSGGAVMVWSDSRNGGSSVYGARLTGDGNLAPNWAYNGTPIRVVFGNVNPPVIVADGGTAFGIAWRDDRVSPSAIYAQRVERFGLLGNPEPVITGVRDVIQDQGGAVLLAWNGSWLDADPMYGVGAYWVWRQVPTTAAFAAIANGAAWLSPDDPPPSGKIGQPALASAARTAAGSRGLYMHALDGATSYSWEFLASLPATGFPSYSYVAATTTDSIPSGNPRTALLLQARAVYGVAYWSSAPDSGYSVDNLPPSMPAPFTGTYASGSTALHWNANTESDLASYRVYRGSTAGFVPGAGNLIASPADTGYADPGSTHFFYKLSAVDVHGNESPFASLTPSGTLDAPGPAVARASFALVPAPSPARGSMVMSFSLPNPTHVTLAIFDAGGRRVFELVRGWRDAGDHRVPWDGRDREGREVPSGLYFARLQAPERMINVRFVRMK